MKKQKTGVIAMGALGGLLLAVSLSAFSGVTQATAGAVDAEKTIMSIPNFIWDTNGYTKTNCQYFFRRFTSPQRACAHARVNSCNPVDWEQCDNCP